MAIKRPPTVEFRASHSVAFGQHASPGKHLQSVELLTGDCNARFSEAGMQSDWDVEAPNDDPAAVAAARMRLRRQCGMVPSESQVPGTTLQEQWERQEQAPLKRESSIYIGLLRLREVGPWSLLSCSELH